MLYLLSVLIGVILLTLLFYIAKKTKPTGKYLEDEEVHYIGTRLQIIGLYLSCLVPIVNIILPVVLLFCGIILLISGEYVFKNEKYNRFSGLVEWLNEKI